MIPNIPDGFRFDVLAQEIVATMTALIKDKGLPARVGMDGMPTRDDAERLRDALAVQFERAERQWNLTQRVRCQFLVRPSTAEGWVVTFTIEPGTPTVVVPKGPSFTT